MVVKMDPSGVVVKVDYLEKSMAEKMVAAKANATGEKMVAHSVDSWVVWLVVWTVAQMDILWVCVRVARWEIQMVE